MHFCSAFSKSLKKSQNSTNKKKHECAFDSGYNPKQDIEMEATQIDKRTRAQAF